MRKFKVYPNGFDPTIAAGPPSDFHRTIGCNWTQEDTLRMLELEKNAKVQLLAQAPQGVWFTEEIST